jgi:hypothetical protein
MFQKYYVPHKVRTEMQEMCFVYVGARSMEELIQLGAYKTRKQSTMFALTQI